MLIFLYGEDDYSSRQKLNEIIDKYKAKHQTGLNFRLIDFREKDVGSLKEATATISMFKEKKLLVLENTFAKSLEWQKELANYLKKSGFEKDGEIALVFYEGKTPDKRVELFKFLTKKPNFSQEAKFFGGVKLENWIKKEVEKKKGKIELAAIKKLAVFAGSDLWQMANEIDKLVSFAGARSIKPEDVESLVKAKIDANIFKTVDALPQKDKRNILKLLHQHLEQGKNEIYLLTMFIRQFRNLLIIKDLLEKGTSYYELPKKTGLHPFVIKKTWEQTKSFSLENLKRIYSKLLEVDLAIKKGKIEPAAALDIFVMSI
jgi:DNA polymerase-3 subunit delta